MPKELEKDLSESKDLTKEKTPEKELSKAEPQKKTPYKNVEKSIEAIIERVSLKNEVRKLGELLKDGDKETLNINGKDYSLERSKGKLKLKKDGKELSEDDFVKALKKEKPIKVNGQEKQIEKELQDKAKKRSEKQRDRLNKIIEHSHKKDGFRGTEIAENAKAPGEGSERYDDMREVEEGRMKSAEIDISL